MSLKHLYAVIALAALAPAAQAQWSGKAELGILSATGNTESKAANAKLDLIHEGSRWRNTVGFAALYSDGAEFSTAERYEAKYQADFKITDRFSWFGALRGEQDRFSAFAYQATVSTGGSYKFIDSPTTQLDASLGAGYRRSQPQELIKNDAGEVIDRIKGEPDNEPVVTLSSNYQHNFTESTKLTNKFLAESGSDNTAVQNDIALSVNMSKSFALAVGLGVRYNSNPPPLAQTTDTLTTVNLVYSIP
jgi:putative salt-induced outer membrane protein YdiY